jgi:tetratricopeptide (TPR) repeat protein
MKSTSIAALLTLYSRMAIAQSGNSDASASARCNELNQKVVTQTASGHLPEAEALLEKAMASGDENVQGACVGYVLSNMAAFKSVSGSPAEAERLADLSVRVLEKFYPPADPIFLRPLEILASVRLELGKTARAREAVKRMQSIPSNGPKDNALVHGIAASLLQTEGRKSEAEAEYLASFRSWEEAGRGDSADAAAILGSLGSLYIQEQRLDDARRTLDNASVIYSRAKDVAPMDRIKFLDLRGVLHSRLGEWALARDYLREALSMADREPAVHPLVLRSLLTNYAVVLRKTHQTREARSIEARAAGLPKDGANASVVDLSDLLIHSKGAAKK